MKGSQLLCFGCEFYIVYACLIILSSPFLCVLGDDLLTCYTRANDVSGGASDARTGLRASMGILLIKHILSCTFFMKDVTF